MHTETLPAATLDLLKTLAETQEIEGFTLVGGTALSLRHGHRISEDLDFVPREGRELPRSVVDTILERLRVRGYTVDLVPNVAAQQDFEDSGLDLADYHQDWMVRGEAGDTKLTFFVAEDQPQLLDGSGRGKFGKVEIAGDAEIFRMKSIVLASQLRSRDLFDLDWLIEKAGFSIDDIQEAFERVRQPTNLRTALDRILRGALRVTDPGFVPADPSGPSIAVVRERLRAAVQTWQAAALAGEARTPSVQATVAERLKARTPAPTASDKPSEDDFSM